MSDSNQGATNKIIIPRELVAPPQLYTDLVLATKTTTNTYLTKSSVELNKCADTCNWQPSEEVQEASARYQSNTPEICILKSENKNFHIVEYYLMNAVNVGLVVLGRVIDRSHKPPLIALTTTDRIFIIATKDQPYVEFLRQKLKEAKIKFWTSNGLNEADSLYANFGIDLADSSSCNDCQAMHAYLMHFLAQQSESVRSKYPLLALVKSKMKPNIECFERLVEIWLDVPAADIEFDPRQLEHLYVQPLTTTALNLIKKRCILVRPLADTLLTAIWQDAQIVSSSFHRRLSMIEDDGLHEDMLKLVRESQRENGDKSILSLEAVVHLAF